MNIACDQCGKVVHKHPSEIKKHNHHFCSRQCTAYYHKTHGFTKRPYSKAFKKIMRFAELKKQINNQTNKITTNSQNTMF